MPQMLNGKQIHVVDSDELIGKTINICAATLKSVLSRHQLLVILGPRFLVRNSLYFVHDGCPFSAKLHGLCHLPSNLYCHFS